MLLKASRPLSSTHFLQFKIEVKITGVRNISQSSIPDCGIFWNLNSQEINSTAKLLMNLYDWALRLYVLLGKFLNFCVSISSFIKYNTYLLELLQKSNESVYKKMLRTDFEHRKHYVSVSHS